MCSLCLFSLHAITLLCRFIGVISIFLFSNKDYNVTCNGSTHFVERSTLCNTQAFFSVFTSSFVVIWAVIFALDVYFHVSSLSPQYDSSSYHRKYTMIALTIAGAMSLSPLCAGNLGYDTQGKVMYCFVICIGCIVF